MKFDPCCKLLKVNHFVHQLFYAIKMKYKTDC